MFSDKRKSRFLPPSKLQMLFESAKEKSRILPVPINSFLTREKELLAPEENSKQRTPNDPSISSLQFHQIFYDIKFDTFLP